MGVCAAASREAFIQLLVNILQTHEHESIAIFWHCAEVLSFEARVGVVGAASTQAKLTKCPLYLSLVRVRLRVARYTHTPSYTCARDCCVQIQVNMSKTMSQSIKNLIFFADRFGVFFET